MGNAEIFIYFLNGQIPTINTSFIYFFLQLLPIRANLILIFSQQSESKLFPNIYLKMNTHRALFLCFEAKALTIWKS